METRRDFIRLITSSCAAGLSLPAWAGDRNVRPDLAIHSPSVSRATRFLVVGDTHLGVADERDDPNKGYYRRMADCSPKNFPDYQAVIQRTNADFIAFVGDLISFPSLLNVEVAKRNLSSYSIPWGYVAGNHDWHFEGVGGTDDEQRADWIPKRLLCLYQGRDPMAYAQEINGIHFLFIDDSTYQISEHQLEIFRKEVSSGVPFVLLMHIPLYLPNLGYYYAQCAHPSWGAAVDDIWAIERRQKWPETGATQTTRTFAREVLGAKNLLGIFTGHIHEKTVAQSGSVIQWTTPYCAGGQYLTIDLLPA